MSPTPARGAFYEAEAKVFASYGLQPQTQLLQLERPKMQRILARRPRRLRDQDLAFPFVLMILKNES